MLAIITHPLFKSIQLSKTMYEYNFEKVQSFHYLDSVLNLDRDLAEETKMRELQESKCFYALKHLFKSPLLNRSLKYELNTSIVHPIVMYGSETWSLTNKQENNRRTRK